MTSLLNNIGKLPYQEYTIEHGVERIKIRVPLKEARNFEAAFAEAVSNDDSKEGLLKVLANHGGTVRTQKAK